MSAPKGAPKFASPPQAQTRLTNAPIATGPSIMVSKGKPVVIAATATASAANTVPYLRATDKMGSVGSKRKADADDETVDDDKDDRNQRSVGCPKGIKKKKCMLNLSHCPLGLKDFILGDSESFNNPEMNRGWDLMSPTPHQRTQYQRKLFTLVVRADPYARVIKTELTNIFNALTPVRLRPPRLIKLSTLPENVRTDMPIVKSSYFSEGMRWVTMEEAKADAIDVKLQNLIEDTYNSMKAPGQPSLVIKPRGPTIAKPGVSNGPTVVAGTAAGSPVGAGAGAGTGPGAAAGGVSTLAPAKPVTVDVDTLNARVRHLEDVVARQQIQLDTLMAQLRSKDNKSERTTSAVGPAAAVARAANKN